MSLTNGSNPTRNGGRSVVNNDEYEGVQLIEVSNRTSRNAPTQTVLTHMFGKLNGTTSTAIVIREANSNKLLESR